MRLRLAALWFLAFPPIAAAAPAKLLEITVDPPQITLTHVDDVQRLLVSGHYEDGATRDLTRTVQFSSTNPTAAEVDDQGIVRPRGPGETTIAVSTQGIARSVAVRVVSAARRPVSFANDVMPILSKTGCNQGACHGAASGKKGFKLSLRGYDPAADFSPLTRGPIGHRINRQDPTQSLIVLKATGSAPHEGGKLFDAESSYAKTLIRWIAEDPQSDSSTAPSLVGLEVFPKNRTLPETNLKQQLLVVARFSDGSSRDVTAEARYSSSNELAASVDETGLVRVLTRGESAVAARYGSKLAVSNLVFLERNPNFVWPDPPEINYVDRHVFAKLKAMQIEPSALCNDLEFLRRVSYDLIGLPPKPDEVRAFLADRRTDKRSRKIDELLERPEHAEFWALKWCDLLKIRFETLGDRGSWGLYRYTRDSIAANKPFDVFVREILTAEGSCAENPAAHFYRVFNTPEEASEATVQIFFGVRLLCAKCHDHPFEKWVQTDYYGMSAFFTQLAVKPGSRREDVVIFRNENVPSARHPNTGTLIVPKFLDGPSTEMKGDRNAREELGVWMTGKENPFFARATVNRMWSHLFGKGIIDPVDDIRSSNPPSNPALLDALTKDFVDHRFDLRALLRLMLNSHTYQLSARTVPSNGADTLNFSHRLPRRLSAEQLLDTISQATGIGQTFRSRYGEATIALPNGGVRAGALPDKQLSTETLDLFGRPRGESACACERHEESSMTQALHLINGKSVIERVQSPTNAVALLVQRPKITDAQIIEELYLRTLARLPNEKEQQLMQQHFTATGTDRLKAAQDVMWVLLNTKEFLFNH